MGASSLDDRFLLNCSMRRKKRQAHCRLREKIERLSLLFDNLDQLYHGKDEISFPQRPIIVLICEDDDHILETWNSVKSMLPEIHNQEIWFSSDLRIFNYNKRGERFLQFVNDTPRPVEIKEFFGIDNEADDIIPNNGVTG